MDFGNLACTALPARDKTSACLLKQPHSALLIPVLSHTAQNELRGRSAKLNKRMGLVFKLLLQISPRRKQNTEAQRLLSAKNCATILIVD